MTCVVGMVLFIGKEKLAAGIGNTAHSIVIKTRIWNESHAAGIEITAHSILKINANGGVAPNFFVSIRFVETTMVLIVLFGEHRKKIDVGLI